jgi:hypothetical protein
MSLQVKCEREDQTALDTARLCMTKTFSAIEKLSEGEFPERESARADAVDEEMSDEDTMMQ